VQGSFSSISYGPPFLYPPYPETLNVQNPSAIDVKTNNILFVGSHSIWTFLLLSYESLKTARHTPNFSLGPYKIPTWTVPLALITVVSLLVPNASLLGHLCGAAVGYTWGLGYIRFLVPPEKILRFVEGKLNLLGRLPHYVSVDQKTYGRYGVLPSVNAGAQATVAEETVPMTFLGQGQRLGP
jgi:hypothetical protein